MVDTDLAAPVATASQQPSRRDRSPNFPAIGLGRALERAQQLYNRARRYEVRLPDAASAWGVKPTSSTTLQLTAALLAFGLVEDIGSGEARKIKISDLGWRVLEDQRPGVREKGLAEAALKPKLIADCAEHWKTGRPDDNFCISELKIERGFTDEAAVRFLKVFDETIQFANPISPDKLSDSQKGERRQPQEDDPPPSIKVGDYVQWTSGGVDQFKPPRRVTRIGGGYAFVYGSLTGLPMVELAAVDPPAPPPVGTSPGVRKSGQSGTSTAKDINILMLGAGRLQITAEVDKVGLATLRQMLDKYEQILDLLAAPGEAFQPPARGEEWSDEESD